MSHQHKFEFADEALTKDGRVERAKVCRHNITDLSKQANNLYTMIDMFRKELVELRRLHDMEGYDGNEL